MRLSLVICLCILSSVCGAKDRSRIVFYSPASESADAVDSGTALQILHQTVAIGSWLSGSVLIYDAGAVKGDYSLRCPVQPSLESNTLHIPELPKGIAIVQVRPGDNRAALPELKSVSYSEFAADYHRLKSIRKQLKTAGFASLQDLVAGYNVVTFKAPSAGVIPKVLKRRVGDTLYQDRRGEPTTRPNAESFSIAIAPDSGSLFLVREYYLPERTLECEYHCTTLDSEDMTGAYTGYYRSGNLETSGNYTANLRHGRWKHYRDSAGAPVWYVTDYKYGLKDGRRVSFYANQSIKRVELWSPYSEVSFPDPKSSGTVYVHERDSLIRGTCFDTAGKEIPFTALETHPVLSVDLPQYLARSLQYPHAAREAGISGRVILQYTVTTKGEIRDVFVLHSAHPELDQEALRVTNAMPRWIPAQIDGKPVDSFLTMPITFQVD